MSRSGKKVAVFGDHPCHNAFAQRVKTQPPRNGSRAPGIRVAAAAGATRPYVPTSPLPVTSSSRFPHGMQYGNTSSYSHAPPPPPPPGSKYPPATAADYAPPPYVKEDVVGKVYAPPPGPPPPGIDAPPGPPPGPRAHISHNSADFDLSGGFRPPPPPAS